MVLAALVSCGPPRERTSAIEPESCLQACRKDPGTGDVRWIDAPLEADRRDLDAWCATVGSPVFVIGAGGNTPPLDSLCVVSWNIEVGGGNLLELVGDIRSGILSYGRPVEHFVILVQEAHRTGAEVPVDVPGGHIPSRKEYNPPAGPRRDIVATVELLGLNLFYVPSMRNGKPGSGDTEEDRGNAVVSTLPLHDLTAIELPFEVHRRVAVAATVRGITHDRKPWSLRLCTMHLDHRSRLSRVFNSAGVGRQRQARALVDAVLESPAVLAGDMNTWALTYTESVVDFVHEAFGQPAELDDRVTLEAKWRPDRRVDYMFYRLENGCAGRYKRLEYRYGSDHWPLMGWVELACPND